VILVDTNLLVYATFADAPEHARGRAWLEERLADESGSVVLCWPVLYAYVRLATSSRVFGRHALAVEPAWASVLTLVEHPATRIVVPGDGHAAIATELAAMPGLRSDDVPDLELAALAIEHGLVLASHDSGFRRFERLRSIDPLAP
jgi:toxin-antitoxin system PIN domain toxin